MLGKNYEIKADKPEKVLNPDKFRTNVLFRSALLVKSLLIQALYEPIAKKVQAE